MKKLKYKAKCYWCGEEAEWRASSLSINRKACSEHKSDLLKLEKEIQRLDDYMTEADNTTWGRI